MVHSRRSRRQVEVWGIRSRRVLLLQDFRASMRLSILHCDKESKASKQEVARRSRAWQSIVASP